MQRPAVSLPLTRPGAAIRAVRRALDRHPIEAVEVRDAMPALERGDTKALVAMQDVIAALVEREDEAYLRLADQGRSVSAMEAFCRARVASALLVLLKHDSPEATVEAIYEAHASLDPIDAEQLLAELKNALGPTGGR